MSHPKISLKTIFLLTEVTMDRSGKKDADNAFVKSEIRSMRDASLRACKEPRKGERGALEGGGIQFMQGRLARRGQLIIGKLRLSRAATKASM